MGLKKGMTNNPNGRVPGSKNKIPFDIKKKMSGKVDESFIEGMFADIEIIDNPKDRAAAKIKVVEFFVPKPRDSGEIETENLLRSALMDRIFPKKDE